jgi:tetratricopeptide (TPR) repeat protein
VNKSIQDLFNDAVRLVDQDQFEDAIKSLQPIINLKALLASAIVQRGRCHWEMHRWKEAKEDFDTGLQPSGQ